MLYDSSINCLQEYIDMPFNQSIKVKLEETTTDPEVQ